MTLLDRERARRISQRAAFASQPFVSEQRIESLRAMVNAGLSGRMLQKWNVILSRSASYTVQGPPGTWFLYNNYGATEPELAWNATVEGRIKSDFMTAADLALRYRVDTSGAKETFATKVAQILTAWAGIAAWDNSTGGSVLSWSDYWPVLLQAALLIRESPAYTTTLHNALKAKTLAMYADLCRPNGIEGSPSTATNNWTSVGNNARMAVAVFAEDRALFNSAIFRWRQIFDDSVVSNFLGVDGELHDNVQQYEVYRQGGTYGDGSYGLLYCNYDFAAKICGAEWARLNGVWLFDHVSPDGSSLEGLFGEIVTLNRYPDAAHHWFNTSSPPARFYSNQIYAGFDVAHALWGVGNVDSEWLTVNRGLGPTSDGVWTDTDHDFMRNTELLYRGQALYG